MQAYFINLVKQHLRCSSWPDCHHCVFVCVCVIVQDLNMYDEKTDTPARTRNSNLNEELGQVSG